MADEAMGAEPDEDEDQLRTKAARAYEEGRFDEALPAFMASALNCALRLFREEGITFNRPLGDITALELMTGLATAAEAELRERGDKASTNISVGTWLFSAAAALRLALEAPVAPNKKAVSLKIAEVAMHGMVMGQVDAIMTAVRLKWLDKLADHEIDRARRRSGAAMTNKRKATLRDSALGEALRITGKNATLSHEDVAVKIRESLGLSTTVKTLTDWVRGWRRQEYIPEQRKT